MLQMMGTESQSDEEPIMSDPAVSAFLTQQLCAHGGRLLMSEIPQHLNLPPAHIASILREEASRFLLLEQYGVVLAHSVVRLCHNYLREQCQALDCDCLHLCRYFVLGRCFHREKGNTCTFSHDTHSDGNKAVLKANKISNLNTKELQVLLMLNDPSLLAEVCRDYKGDKKEGSCTKGANCSRLHICGYFARGQCRHSRCNRSHNLLHPETIRLLQARGLSMEMIQNIQLMRVHLSNEAQKEPRKNNIKGNSRSTTYSYYSRQVAGAEAQQSSNRDMREPMRPLLPAPQPTATFTVFPKTEPNSRIFHTNKPGVEASVECFPPPPSEASQYASDTWAARPTNRNVPMAANPCPPATGTATIHSVTSPLPRVAQTNMPDIPTSDRCVSTPSNSERAYVPPAWSPQPNSLNAHVSLGLSPPTPASTVLPTTTHLPRAAQTSKPVEHASVPPTNTIYTSYTGITHRTEYSLTNRLADTEVSILPSNSPLSSKYGSPSESSSSFQLPVSNPPTTPAYDNCPQLHFYLPYRWQVSERTGEWRDLLSMEEIEKAYCDPYNTTSIHHNIDFVKMTSSLNKVQRLSTASSVTKSPEYILTTEWVWYWKTEFGQWIEYGKYGGHETVTLASADLESIYLADKKAVVPFEAGYQKYEIHFKDMIQRNLLHGTETEVLRRPRFVSEEEVMKIKASSKGTRVSSSAPEIPFYWDRTALPNLGYQLVELHKGSSEFNKILIQFEKTMCGHSIEKMKRIQNPSLWRVYQREKNQMKTLNNEKDVLEKKLFHATTTCDVEAICRDNLGWSRNRGSATLYGKGMYFSRDASYSHQNHQTSSASKTMFLARVLVGDFVRGYPHYTMPHPKIGNPRNVYSSCVDNECEPSTFVIFRKEQIYPEYLLEYTENKTEDNTKDTAWGNVPDKMQDNVQGNAQDKALDTTKKSKKEKDKCCIS